LTGETLDVQMEAMEPANVLPETKFREWPEIISAIPVQCFPASDAAQKL